MSYEFEDQNGPKEKSFLRRFTTFGIIGLLLTVGGAWFIETAVSYGIQPLLANFIQAIISIVLNFVGNERLTWGDRQGLTRREKVIRFAKVKAFTLSFNQVLFLIGLWSFPVFVVGTHYILPAILPIYRFFPENTFAYWFSTSIIMVFNYIAGDRYVYAKK